MKKVLFAAALVALAGVASADLCDEILGPKDGCTLYKVQFKFKTLAGKDAKCTLAQLASDACQALDADIAKKGIAYLDNVNRTFDGILWQCKSACFEGAAPNEGAAGAGPINFALWEKKQNLAISPLIRYTAPTADASAEWATDDEAAKFLILGRYGNKAQKVTAYWTPTINAALTDVEITAAGFGTFNAKDMVIKSMSGNAVAKLIPVTVTSGGTLCTDGTDMLTVLAYMCHDFKGWCCCQCVAQAIAPASGTWSLKNVNSKNQKLSKLVPEYMIDMGN